MFSRPDPHPYELRSDKGFFCRRPEPDPGKRHPDPHPRHKPNEGKALRMGNSKYLQAENSFKKAGRIFKPFLIYVQEVDAHFI